MLTVTLLLLVSAFIITLLSALNPSRAPLWVAVLFLIILELLQVVPR